MTARFPGLVLSDWRTRLVHDHPRLFPDARLVHGRDGPGLASAGWPEVPDGWADLLATACTRLAGVLAREGPDTEAAITRAAEKCGTLRLDVMTGGLSVAGTLAAVLIVDLAEARSAHVCAVCGGRGRPMVSGGWIAALCLVHAEGHTPLPGDPDLVVTTHWHDGRPVRSARRYRPDHDRFVAVPVLPDDCEE